MCKIDAVIQLARSDMRSKESAREPGWRFIHKLARNNQEHHGTTDANLQAGALRIES